MAQSKQQKMKVSNKYRKTIYFGKDLYVELDDMAKALGIPFSTMIRMTIEMGLKFSQAIERGLK